MNTRQLAKQAVKNQIALITITLAIKKGYEETTIEEVSKKLGMSTRTFFRYFRSKDDVLLEATHEFCSAFLASFESKLQSKDTLWNALTLTLEELAIDCDDPQKNESTLPSAQRVIEKTPSLIALQLAALETLQIKTTDKYLSYLPPTKPHDWWTVNAVVRTAFACLQVIRCRPPESDAKKAFAKLMHELKPTVSFNL